MLSYIIRRVIYALITLVVVTVIGFIIIDLPPGSYLDTYVSSLRASGSDLATEDIQALEARYGMNDPLLVRFWKWISNFVVGDFGESFQHNMPVKDLIWERLQLTIIFAVVNLLISWILAITIGVYSATHRYRASDYLITGLQFTGLAVPPFLLALVVMVFAQQVLQLNVGGLFSPEFETAPWTWAKFVDLMNHVWIPVVVISASNTAWLSRVMRSNLLDVMGMQYVQTARAKGLPESTVVWKHAVRNALHPLVMAFGMSFPAMISGQTVVSLVLNLPTTGPLLFTALLNQDMYLAGTFLIFLTVMLVVGNLFADIVLAWLDPRIQYE
jgi:peptide/nickel transport system permease protein